MVAGHVQPVAEVDRLAQAQRRDGRRLGVRHRDRGQVLQVARADAVQGGDLGAHVGLSGRRQAGAGDHARPSGL
jgi:hypothetical protein